MTSRDYAQLVAAAVLQKEEEEHKRAAAEFMCGGHGVIPRNIPSPEPTDDFNREYDIAPWAFDGD